MRKLLTLGLAIAAVGVVGCNNSSGKSSSRAAAAVTSATTGTTGSGSSGSTSADAPQVATVSPANGPVDGGTAVVINGTNFTKAGAGQTMVLFGTRGVVATPVSDTEIRVTAPIQTNAGLVDVRVINDIGVGTSAGAFTYDPRTTGVTFSPLVGTPNPAGQGGTKITLDLVSFAPITSAATVSFGATRATEVVVVDADTIIAQVPSGLLPGLSSITVTEGTMSISAQGFRVQGTLVYGDLVFNEVLTGPGGTDPNKDGVASSIADEFLEIVNTTGNPIDLTYILLKDNLNPGQSAVINHRFSNPTSIPAGGSIVVFGGGMPDGFAERHQSGSAQQSTSTSGTLGLTSGETVMIEDQHGLLAGTVIFKVTLPAETAGTSFTLKNEGQRITTNPATAADYELHPDRTVTGQASPTVKHSAGTKRDGTSF